MSRPRPHNPMLPQNVDDYLPVLQSLLLTPNIRRLNPAFWEDLTEKLSLVELYGWLEGLKLDAPLKHSAARFVYSAHMYLQGINGRRATFPQIAGRINELLGDGVFASTDISNAISQLRLSRRHVDRSWQQKPTLYLAPALVRSVSSIPMPLMCKITERLAHKGVRVGEAKGVGMDGPAIVRCLNFLKAEMSDHTGYFLTDMLTAPSAPGARLSVTNQRLRHAYRRGHKAYLAEKFAR